MSTCTNVIAQAHRLHVRILHLATFAPRFLTAGHGKHRFSPILFDFRYFSDTAAAESRVESSRHLQSLEEEMREGYGFFLAKLWDLYARTVQLQQQALALLNNFTQLQDVEGLQSMVALLGSVFMLLDKCIPGMARERSIVAHIRLNSGSQLISNQAPAIVRLFAATGFDSSSANLPTGYPEQYLARCKLPKAAIHSIITHCLSTPPSAVQRTSAQQVYIALYFVPEALHGDTALMKAVAAKHFSQSWVVPWAPGQLAEVCLDWQRYRAARNALGAVLTPARAKGLAAEHGAQALPLQRSRTRNLQGNIAKGKQSLDSLPELLSCIAANNATLCWLLLHGMAGQQHRKQSTAVSKQSAAVAKQGVDEKAVIGLLLDTAALESWVKTSYHESTQHQWEAHCSSIAGKLLYAAESALGDEGSRLRDLAKQASELAEADMYAAQQLQLALDALQYTADSPQSQTHDDRHQSPGHADATQPQATQPYATHSHVTQQQQPSALSQSQISSKMWRPTDPSADQSGVPPSPTSPSQNPFAESSGLRSPQASAGVGAWNPWADDLNHKASSSPHYQPGSSDSDWDDPEPRHDHPDDPVVIQNWPQSHEEFGEEQAVYANDNSRVKSAVAEAQHRLDQLVGLAASHAEVQKALARECDLGYAWGLIGTFADHLQHQIRDDPKALRKFNAMVIKLRSVMTPSLASLMSCEEEDREVGTAEVMSYFTQGLLGLTHNVLKVVPVLFFQSLDAAIAIHHAHTLSFPDRPEKAELKEYACFPERAELAKLTQSLAAYSCNLRAFDSAAVAPQKHDTMEGLKQAISTGIARRIAQACTHRLTFSQLPASLLISAPVQAGGLLSGVTAGFAGSSGEIANRTELSTQLRHLAAELSTLKSSFGCMQEFIQLPLVTIWQQQLRSVMQQALTHELSSLPQHLQNSSTQQRSAQSAGSQYTASMPYLQRTGQQTESTQATVPEQASSESTISRADALTEAQTKRGSDSVEQLRDSLQAGPSATFRESVLSDTLLTQPVPLTVLTQHGSHATQQNQSEESPSPALPVEAMSRQSSGQTPLPGQAGRMRPPQQATHRGLPQQATPAQPTFLRMCLAELLRLTNPAQSQFQPVLCGWYTTEGVELVGLRGCRALRQALGVAGVRALDRLLEVRMIDGLQQLSSALTAPQTSALDLDRFTAAYAPASQSASHSALPATPDPAAFKEAIRSGGKLWPLLCHYLAPLGQACLLRQRLASDLHTAERLLTPGRLPKDQPTPSRTSSSQQMQNGLHNQMNGRSHQSVHHDSQASQAADLPLPLSGEELNHSTQHLSNPSGQPGPSDDSATQPLSADTSSRPAQTSGQRPQVASLQQDHHQGVVMLLCILSLMPRCSFNGRLGILERQSSQTGLPDLYAVMQGLVGWLQSQDIHHFEVLLQLANQYISAYTQVATSTTALSVQAAGIQIGLPAEIGRLLAFLEQTSKAAGQSRQFARQILSPFLLDNWHCLVLSEKGL